MSLSWLGLPGGLLPSLDLWLDVDSLLSVLFAALAIGASIVFLLLYALLGSDARSREARRGNDSQKRTASRGQGGFLARVLREAYSYASSLQAWLDVNDDAAQQPLEVSLGANESIRATALAATNLASARTLTERLEAALRTLTFTSRLHDAACVARELHRVSGSTAARTRTAPTAPDPRDESMRTASPAPAGKPNVRVFFCVLVAPPGEDAHRSPSPPATAPAPAPSVTKQSSRASGGGKTTRTRAARASSGGAAAASTLAPLPAIDESYTKMAYVSDLVITDNPTLSPLRASWNLLNARRTAAYVGGDLSALHGSPATTCGCACMCGDTHVCCNDNDCCSHDPHSGDDSEEESISVRRLPPLFTGAVDYETFHIPHDMRVVTSPYALMTVWDMHDKQHRAVNPATAAAAPAPPPSSTSPFYPAWLCNGARRIDASAEGTGTSAPTAGSGSRVPLPAQHSAPLIIDGTCPAVAAWLEQFHDGYRGGLHMQMELATPTAVAATADDDAAKRGAGAAPSNGIVVIAHLCADRRGMCDRALFEVYVPQPATDVTPSPPPTAAAPMDVPRKRTSTNSKELLALTIPLCPAPLDCDGFLVPEPRGGAGDDVEDVLLTFHRLGDQARGQHCPHHAINAYGNAIRVCPRGADATLRELHVHRAQAATEAEEWGVAITDIHIALSLGLPATYAGGRAQLLLATSLAHLSTPRAALQALLPLLQQEDTAAISDGKVALTLAPSPETWDAPRIQARQLAVDILTQMQKLLVTRGADSTLLPSEPSAWLTDVLRSGSAADNICSAWDASIAAGVGAVTVTALTAAVPSVVDGTASRGVVKARAPGRTNSSSDGSTITIVTDVMSSPDASVASDAPTSGVELTWLPPRYPVLGRGTSMMRGGYWHSANLAKHGRLYVFGGFSETDASSDMFMYATRTRAWLPLCTLPTAPPGPYYFHTASLVRDKLFFIGGAGCDAAANTRTLAVFDTNALKWETVTTSGDWPGQLACHAAAAVGERYIYVHGGMNGAADVLSGAMGDVSSSTFVLDTASCRWSFCDTEGGLPPARFGHTLLAYDPAVHGAIGGALGAGADMELCLTSLGATADTMGDSKMWLTSAGPKLITFGGKGTPISHEGPCLNDVHVLNVDSLTWLHPVVLGAPPLHAVFHASVLVGHFMMVFGGEGPTATFMHVYVLDLHRLVWSTMRTTPDPGTDIRMALHYPARRFGHSAVAVLGAAASESGGKDKRSSDPLAGRDYVLVFGGMGIEEKGGKIAVYRYAQEVDIAQLSALAFAPPGTDRDGVDKLPASLTSTCRDITLSPKVFIPEMLPVAAAASSTKPVAPALSSGVAADTQAHAHAASRVSADAASAIVHRARAAMAHTTAVAAAAIVAPPPLPDDELLALFAETPAAHASKAARKRKGHVSGAGTVTASSSVKSSTRRSDAPASNARMDGPSADVAASSSEEEGDDDLAAAAAMLAPSKSSAAVRAALAKLSSSSVADVTKRGGKGGKKQAVETNTPHVLMRASSASHGVTLSPPASATSRSSSAPMQPPAQRVTVSTTSPTVGADSAPTVTVTRAPGGKKTSAAARPAAAATARPPLPPALPTSHSMLSSHIAAAHPPSAHEDAVPASPQSGSTRLTPPPPAGLNAQAPAFRPSAATVAAMAASKPAPVTKQQRNGAAAPARAPPAVTTGSPSPHVASTVPVPATPISPRMTDGAAERAGTPDVIGGSVIVPAVQPASSAAAGESDDILLDFVHLQHGAMDENEEFLSALTSLLKTTPASAPEPMFAHDDAGGLLPSASSAGTFWSTPPVPPALPLRVGVSGDSSPAGGARSPAFNFAAALASGPFASRLTLGEGGRVREAQHATSNDHDMHAALSAVPNVFANGLASMRAVVVPDPAGGEGDVDARHASLLSAWAGPLGRWFPTGGAPPSSQGAVPHHV